MSDRRDGAGRGRRGTTMVLICAGELVAVKVASYYHDIWRGNAARELPLVEKEAGLVLPALIRTAGEA